MCSGQGRGDAAAEQRDGANRAQHTEPGASLSR